MGGDRKGIDIVKKEKKDMNGSIWSIFMHADGQDWFLMVLGIIGAIGEGLTTPLILCISSHMMNNIGSSSSMEGSTFIHNINKNAVAWLYLACASFIVCFLEGYCWTRTSGRQAARMRCRYLKAVLRQEVAYFDLQVTSTSEIITSVSNDSLLIQDVLSEKVPNFLMNISLFIGSYIAAFAMLWRLAIVAFPFLVLLVIPGLIYGKTLMVLASKIREEYNQASTIAEQTISSIRTVYSFVGESKSMNAFSSSLQGTVKFGIKQGLAKGLAIGSNGVVFAIWSFMCYYGSKLVMYHGAKGGTVFAVGAAITVGGLGLGTSLSTLKNISEACCAGERIKRVIQSVPKIDSDNMTGETTSLDNTFGEIEFDHIKFAYPTRPESIILNNLCLKIQAGKTVALVGESGSGKSTVISLLQRFYDPLEGEIRIDGVAINKLQVKLLRSMMGLVSQEPILFATSIKENIVFGKEDASEEEIIEAARICNAHDFISMLPKGYHTQVGERGIQLSGGQKQRIAIARAIIKKPRILLLDEATSALDAESERFVQQSLDKSTATSTTIIIAHRLSTIQNVDTVAVMRGGKVTEFDSHENLIKNHNSFYTSLVRLQQKEIVRGTTTSTIPISTREYIEITHRVGPANSVGNDILNNKSEEDAKPINTVSFRRVLALNIPEWKHAILGCLNAVMFGAVQPVYAFAMGSMIFVYFEMDHEEIKKKTRVYSLCFLGLSLISLVVNVGQHYNFGYMGENVTKRVRESMLEKILTFEVGWFDRDENSSGVVCSRLANDANVVRSLVGDRMALLVQTFSAVATAYTIGLVISWRLTIVMIAVQPIIIFCFYTRRVLLKSMSSKAHKAQQQSSKLAAEAVSNHRTITAFSSQARILKMLENAQQGPTNENIRQSWYAGLGLGCSQFLTSCSWALNFWYGGKLIVDGDITKKALFESFMVVVSTGRVIADAGSMTKDLAKGADVVGSIFAILDRCTKIEPNDPNGYKPETLMGRIELCDVHFAYPARPNVVIFEGFSIKIEEGKSTALVGQSGSGKSTIIGLIERFYDPIKGLVTIDGINIKSYNLKSLRKHIALVSQEPTLISGTIRENIAYGTCDKIDESEIIEASRVANAHDFISSLKDGYETLCGDKGVQLSGGQKQRIAIARAMLKNPKVLLLDEATSALDNHSERVVQEAINKVMVGRTSVVVAHRLSTIQNCDVIAVLDKGKLVEIGTHSSLLDKGPYGAYYSLVHLQTRQVEIANDNSSKST